jgi:hypothetical protein
MATFGYCNRDADLALASWLGARPYGRRGKLCVWSSTPGAKATLGRCAKRLLFEYLESMAAEPVGRAPIFRNRSGAPYSKDTLGDDFRSVRLFVFGLVEERQLADFRRSGSVDAFAGDAPPEKVSAKMANSLSASNRLHRTYAPVQLAAVRDVDAARTRGRTKLRAAAASETKQHEKSNGAGPDSNNGVQKKD